MPPSKRPKNVRLNLDISPAVRDRIEWLKDATDAESLTEVIRRSLAVYELLVDQQQQGSTIYVRNRRGAESNVLLAPG